MHTLNKRSTMGFSADQFYRHEEEIEEEQEMMGPFGCKKAPVDLNGACVWEKQGSGLEAVDLGDIQLNIRERFAMEAPADFTREGSPDNGNTVKGEAYNRDYEEKENY